MKRRLANSVGQDALLRRTEARGLARVRPGDICYFWPGSNIDAMHRARRAGAVVVIEFINTHVEHRYRIIGDAAHERGLPATEVRQPKHEREARIAVADIGFAPGPFVSKSVRGFSDHPLLLIECSYGAHLPDQSNFKCSESSRVQFLFVGRMELRKGAFDLIDAWQMTDSDADLVIAGHVDDDVEAYLQNQSLRSVFLRGYQQDITTLYGSSDVLVFPSLEEGGPQVCYEAAAHGLPMIVTPMGGGRIADYSNALIVPPRDPKALAEAIRRMAADPELRARLGEGSRKAAPYYDWKEVSKRRLAQLLEAASVVQANRT